MSSDAQGPPRSDARGRQQGEGEKRDESLGEALPSAVSQFARAPLESFAHTLNTPCARPALLFGFLAGASVGALRFVFAGAGRRRVRGGGSALASAANWAVGAWGVGALGAWETCRARQTAEQVRMRQLVESVKMKRAAKKGGAPSSSPEQQQQQQFPRGVWVGEHAGAERTERTGRTEGAERQGAPQRSGETGRWV